MITLDDLERICPFGKAQTMESFVEPLNSSMTEFEINTIDREPAFIAQVAHESGSFRYVQEIASGQAYEGRVDLGNTDPGDGVRFKGRGLIQITGRSNYRKCGEALGLDLIANPSLLEEPVNACRSAAWFWQTHGCNELADAGDFRGITRKINGGFNGYADRLAYFTRAQKVLT